MRDLPNLDFLRACAVLSVVLEHTLLALRIRHLGRIDTSWIGVVGVFFFFVHTCLVLMWSLERQPHTLDFYIRRAFRIYPLAWAAMLAIVVFHAPVAGSVDNYFRYMDVPHDSGAVLRGILLIPNLGSKVEFQPASVMWSLPLEVEMYIGLPVLFFFVRRNFSLWPLLLFWTLIVWVNRPLLTHANNSFYQAVPYFLPGVMAYVGFGRYKAFLPASTFPMFLAVLWGWFLRDPYWQRADILCLGLGLALPWFRQITWMPAIRASHTVARYSYGIYLSHPFAIVLAVYLLPHVGVFLQVLIILSTTTGISVAAYHLLEHPAIRLGARIANRAEKRFEQHEAEQLRIPAAEIF